MKLDKAGAVFAVAFSLAGCGQMTIFETFDLHRGVSLSTDARQRVITNVKVNDDSIPGQIRPDRVVCAEPTPEVAVALANSFGLGVSILGQGSGSLSAAQSETLLQLAERTATIQLMRDQLYRACEAYSNGSISGTTYSVIISRINDTMVTLMLGETAAGKTGRSLGAIGTSANASAQASMQLVADSIKGLDQQATKLAEANQKVDEAETTAKKERGAAATLHDKAKGKPAADADAIAAVAQENVAKKAEAEAVNRRAERDALLQLMKTNVSTATQAAAKTESIINVGAVSAGPSDSVARSLSEMQAAFLGDDNIKALTTACIVELGNQAAGSAEEQKSKKVEAAPKQKTKTPPSGKDDEKKNQDKNTLYNSMVRNWIERSIAAGDKPDDKNLQEQAYFALSRLISYDRRAERSALTEFCSTEMRALLAQANSDRKLLNERRLQVDLQVERNKALAAVDGLVAACDKLKDETNKDECRKNWLGSLTKIINTEDTPMTARQVLAQPIAPK